MSVRRLVATCLIVVATLSISAPVLATEETTDTAATESTVASIEDAGVTPAVTVPPVEADTGPDDWTYRFLIPTLIALAVIVVIATTVQYFIQVVRKRYKVVE